MATIQKYNKAWLATLGNALAQLYVLTGVANYHLGLHEYVGIALVALGFGGVVGLVANVPTDPAPAIVPAAAMAALKAPAQVAAPVPAPAPVPVPVAPVAAPAPIPPAVVQ